MEHGALPVYQVIWLPFLGNALRPILCQPPDTVVCPLLAVCNAQLLRGGVRLQAGTVTLTHAQVLALAKGSIHGIAGAMPRHAVEAHMDRMHAPPMPRQRSGQRGGGLTVDPLYRHCADFTELELGVFSACGLKLYHFLVADAAHPVENIPPSFLEGSVTDALLLAMRLKETGVRALAGPLEEWARHGTATGFGIQQCMHTLHNEELAVLYHAGHFWTIFKRCRCPPPHPPGAPTPPCACRTTDIRLYALNTLSAPRGMGRGLTLGERAWCQVRINAQRPMCITPHGDYPHAPACYRPLGGPCSCQHLLPLPPVPLPPVQLPPAQLPPAQLPPVQLPPPEPSAADFPDAALAKRASWLEAEERRLLTEALFASLLTPEPLPPRLHKPPPYSRQAFLAQHAKPLPALLPPVYRVAWLPFVNGQRPVLCQPPGTMACPLLAVCNVLLLCGAQGGGADLRPGCASLTHDHVLALVKGCIDPARAHGMPRQEVEARMERMHAWPGGLALDPLYRSCTAFSRLERGVFGACCVDVFHFLVADAAHPVEGIPHAFLEGSQSDVQLLALQLSETGGGGAAQARALRDWAQQSTATSFGIQQVMQTMRNQELSVLYHVRPRALLLRLRK